MYVNFSGNSQETPVCGAYVRSFAQGLDDVLQDYRQALLDIESSLLADPHLTAASVQTSLEEVKHVYIRFFCQHMLSTVQLVLKLWASEVFSFCL